MRAAVYARISDDRAGEGLGVARQEQDCRALCDRLGWEVAQTYVDNDTSAYSGKPRPSYLRLLDDIRNRAVDALVVWHPDRLHRSPRELEDFIDLVERTGLAIATVQAGDYDLTTPAGRMTARIVGAVARGESEHKSARVRSKLLQNAAAGKPHGGRRPFGYRDGDVDPEEAELIREAARRVLAGDGLKTITNDWNARALGSWYPSGLKRVLVSGRVAGLRESKGEIVAQATWPAILDRETWEQLRVILNDPSRRPGGSQARSYLLTGLLYCGVCGKLMRARPTPRGRRYECLGYHNLVTAAPVDDLVVLKVRERLASDAFAQQLNTQPEDGDLAAQIAFIETELAQWDADKTIVGRARWLAATRRLESELKALRRRFAVQARQFPSREFTGRWVDDDRWAGLGLDRQRSIIGDLVERVTVNKVGRVGRFDESRVQLVWRI